MHGDAVEDDVDVNEFSEEATGVMPPLPPASWVKKTETSKHTEMYCRKFRKPCNEDRRHEESPFFDCWDWKQEQSDFFCSKWILGHETHQCVRSWVCTDIYQIKLNRTSFFRTSVPVGKSPIGVAFGILWIGSVVRVNVATLKGVAFGISRTITKRLDLTSGSSLGFRLRPHNRRDPSLRCDRQTGHQKNVRSAPLVRKKGVGHLR